MSYEGIRVDPADYEALPLRAHEILRDVPLHDAWRIRLAGAGPDTRARDVLTRFLAVEATVAAPSVRALFALRKLLGGVFGWDGPPGRRSPESYVSRLTEEDRARSADEPGSALGPATVIYTFEREALAEVINRTVHAFLSFAVAPDGAGCTVCWGVHVKPVGRLTTMYMALIDPFRHWIVYPALIERFEAEWDRGGPTRH